jgi:hypothetical protein
MWGSIATKWEIDISTVETVASVNSCDPLEKYEIRRVVERFLSQERVRFYVYFGQEKMNRCATIKDARKSIENMEAEAMANE